MWQQKLGHPSYDILIDINKMFPIPNLSKPSTHCDACLATKHKRPTFPNNNTHYDKRFDLIHMDI